MHTWRPSWRAGRCRPLHRGRPPGAQPHASPLSRVLSQHRTPKHAVNVCFHITGVLAPLFFLDAHLHVEEHIKVPAGQPRIIARRHNVLRGVCPCQGQRAIQHGIDGGRIPLMMHRGVRGRPCASRRTCCTCLGGMYHTATLPRMCLPHTPAPSHHSASALQQPARCTGASTRACSRGGVPWSQSARAMSSKATGADSAVCGTLWLWGMLVLTPNVVHSTMRGRPRARGRDTSGRR